MIRLALAAAFLAIGTLLPAANAQAALDDAARAGVVAKAAEALRNRYVYPDKGEAAAAKLEAQLAAGAYKDLTQPRAFADQLTKDLYEITKDKHLRASAPGPAPVPAAGAPPPAPPPKSEAGVIRTDRLAGNVGYIEVVGFPGPAAFTPVIDKAMATLADASAIILDLRRNNGGSAESDAYLSSHFTDPKKKSALNSVINRKPNTLEFTTHEYWAQPTKTNVFGKPLYVLISQRTFSAGEAVAYDLQCLKLGTFIGETTGGGANPGGVGPLGAGMSMFVPAGRAENPATKTNWEGVGVIPDIKAPAADALKVALEKLGQKPASGDIEALSVARLFEPRTTPTPGLEALARRIIDGDAKGEPALDIMAPGLAQAAQAQRDSLMKGYARSGPLKSLTFQGPGPGGGDAYGAVFEYNTRPITIVLGADGKVAGFTIGPPALQNSEQLKASFKRIDLNTDGKLDKAEYKEMLTTIGFPEMFDSLFATIDDNKDGVLTAAEYEAHPQ